MAHPGRNPWVISLGIVVSLGLVVAALAAVKLHASLPRGDASGAAPSATTNSRVPSGVAVPTADPPGWRLVYSDDFEEPALRPYWYVHESSPDDGNADPFLRSHVVTTGGELVIRGYREGERFVTGSLDLNLPISDEPFGKYEVRFRMDTGKHVGYAVMLWPNSGKWPDDGEIDFVGEPTGARGTATASLVLGRGEKDVTRHELGADLSEWHTAGVEWTENRLTYTMDGRPWASVRSRRVPASAHHLVIQTRPCGASALPCPGRPAPENANLEIDWVNVYVPSQ